MGKLNIKEFYEAAVKEGKFSSKFFKGIKEISTEEEFRNFIEEKVQPVAKEMGYIFSTDELVIYEKQMAKKITEQQLENISGGVDVKNLALGGIVSLMALGAGIIGTVNSASAELSAQEIVNSENLLVKESNKVIEVPKKDIEKKSKKKSSKKEAEKIEISQVPKAGESEISETSKAEESVAVEGQAAELQKREDQPQLQKTPDTNADLEMAKNAAKVETTNELESHKLTDEQKLYALKALNLQDAYALLQSGVIENLRLFGNISEIELKENGDRIYTADKGDAFAELLYMLYPSNGGTLNTSGNGDRDNFSKFGGISPELMAKFCSILNDYRNGKISTTATSDKKSEGYFPIKKIRNQMQYNKDQKKLTGIFTDFLNFYKFTFKEEGEEKINRSQAQANFYGDFIETLFKCIEMETSKETKNDIENLSAEIKNIGKFKEKKKKQEKLNALKAKIYPEYLTERILMSYMIKKLNTEKDVHELYQNIAKELAQNETNKEVNSENKQAEIQIEKERIGKFNEIINAIKTQNLSPYKNRPQQNDSTYKIGGLGDDDGKVQIAPIIDGKISFADCVDITVRHVINLLTYSNNQDWDMLLPKDTEFENVNSKLKKVVDAINSKGKVKFYDLKTRLQMFFLYQRGFLDGVDKEEDQNYRSPNGADDTTALARTLWEYAICNMDEENLKKSLDKKEGYYSIKYVDNKNFELETGYINMLKLMWNIAKALELGEEEQRADAKNKIDQIKNGADEKKYDENNFKEAINSTFALFNGNDKEYDLSNCRFSGNELLGEITINITKDSKKLNFSIFNESGHAYVDHIPQSFTWNDEFNDEKYDFDEANLIFRSFDKNKVKNNPTGFYGAFSGEELTEDDTFKNTELYKKYKALIAFNDLQDEEANYTRIMKIIDFGCIKGAKTINVKTKGGNKNLSDVFCEKYLEPNVGKTYSIEMMIEFAKYCMLNDFYLSDNKESREKISAFEFIKKSEDRNEVNLFLKKNTAEELTIPAKVYDENGVEYEVISVWKIEDEFKELVKVELDENLKKWTTLNEDAFKKFNELKNFKILDGVTSLKIGKRAFNECKALTSFKIPNSVTSLEIGDNAFSYCGALTSFEIPNSVTSLKIRAYAFKSCSKLANFKIQANVTSLEIEGEAFRFCKALESFNIQANVTSLEIGKEAFNGCKALTSFKIPESVTSLEIRDNAFSYCGALTNFEIPNSVTSLKIWDMAFIDCQVLTSFEIPNSVTSLKIGKMAFNDCKALTSFKIPESVTSLEIRPNAFGSCGKLESFNIQANVTSLGIGKRAFESCVNLESFKIPESVTSLEIGEYAFNFCLALENFNIPGNVTILKIGNMAFGKCMYLTSFKIPESVTSLEIRDNAFRDCKALTSFEIPKRFEKEEFVKNLGANVKVSYIDN